MWRVIIRMSFDYDRGSKLRYRVEKRLEECGILFSRATGTWEGLAVRPQDATKQLQHAMALLSDPRQISGVGRARLDHLWIYIDRAKNQTVSKPTT